MRARALAFAYRFSSGVRVSWASSTAFATLGTAAVTLLVLPLRVRDRQRHRGRARVDQHPHGAAVDLGLRPVMTISAAHHLGRETAGRRPGDGRDGHDRCLRLSAR